MRHVMREGGYLLVLAVLSACSIRDFAFEKPGVGEGPPGANDAAVGSPSPGPGDAASQPPGDAPGGEVPPEAQSCASLPQTCGEHRDENCCLTLRVPGGTYFRGYDTAKDNIHNNQDFPATVNTFKLDKFEVTVGRFRAFVESGHGLASSPPGAGAGAHPTEVTSGWSSSWPLPANNAELNDSFHLHCSPTGGTWYLINDSNETQKPPDKSIAELRPINCVSWYEAMAFCIWDGGYLPTEAEWGLAATTTDQRPYPWSNPQNPDVLDIDTTRLSGSFPSDDHCVGDGDPACSASDLLPVGSKPAGNGKYGHADLAGNVDEWTFDATDAQAKRHDSPCSDCMSIAPNPMLRLAHSGSVAGAREKQRTSLVVPITATRAEYITGFRCARPAP